MQKCLNDDEDDWVDLPMKSWLTGMDNLHDALMKTKVTDDENDLVDILMITWLTDNEDLPN